MLRNFIMVFIDFFVFMESLLLRNCSPIVVLHSTTGADNALLLYLHDRSYRCLVTDLFFFHILPNCIIKFIKDMSIRAEKQRERIFIDAESLKRQNIYAESNFLRFETSV